MRRRESNNATFRKEQKTPLRTGEDDVPSTSSSILESERSVLSQYSGKESEELAERLHLFDNKSNNEGSKSENYGPKFKTWRFFNHQPLCNESKSTKNYKLAFIFGAASIICLLILLFQLFLRNNGELGDDVIWPEAQELHKRHFRSVYSDVQAKDGQIWLINLHEIRRRRHLSGTLASESTNKNSTKQRLFGLARSCGLYCTFKLRHDNGKSGQQRQQFDVQLTRRRFNSYKKDGKEQSITSLIQYVDSDDQIRAQTSRISADCIYEARVSDGQEVGMVNLCEPNGGLFGTLALPQGAFIIEPLVSDDSDNNSIAQNEDSQNDLTGTQNGRSKRSASLRILRPHLIYSPRSHQFDPPLTQNSLNTANSTQFDHIIMENDENGEFSVNDSTSEEDSDELDEKEDASSQEQMEEEFAFNGYNFSRIEAHNRRPKRSANSWDHYVEVLVVADYKMLVYHQNNLENYVLTLFSTVASIYRHASIQASVNIVVVRIVILKHERAGPRISNRAQETLQQFCAWQQTYNDRNDDSIAHHDVAILLTRHDICRATNKCDTLGLAELGTMCDARKSCAIIEDNGLSAAFTIAHELGHIFNIPHDDERKCSQYMPLNKNSYHLMAPTLEYNTNPWGWSACSSAMLNKFLDSQRSQTQCLLDQPVERKYFDKMFNYPEAGVTYSVNRQCQFVFGAAAEICPYMPTCRRLWCSTYYGFQMGCRTLHSPWMDGTPCGPNSWCHHGQCVGIPPNQRPKVDGGWGEWQPFGGCSRTCGGGVQKGARECDNPVPLNGGKYCIGQRERYKSCNTHECPFETAGFREVQCAEFNDRDVGIHGIPKSTKWIPKYTGISENERCRLYCRAHDSAAFYLLKEKVLDGTSCARNIDDICIDGTCHQAGCDHRLGSSMRRDNCGVCGGDGSSCETVQGIYNERGSFGYNEILKIPAGSANIDISQNSHNNLKEDDNYLALRTSTGEFLLNGQYQVSVFRQQIPVQDTVLEYSGSDHSIERINGTGPLRSDIYVHVLSVGNLNPPDVRYKYMLPRNSAPQGRPPNQIRLQPANYYWSYPEQWSQCSLKCQGTQTQMTVCLDAVSTKPVMDDYCVAKRPDPNTRMCNVDCFLKWRSTATSGCSARCGSGEREQQNQCFRTYTSSSTSTQSAKPDEQANERECLTAGLQKPPDRVPCFTDCAGRKWSYSEWNTCSASCGNSGVIRRQASCVDGANRRLDERHCEQMPKEAVESECNRIPCPKWSYSAWSECSRSCDGGVRVRHAACQDGAGREVPAQMCTASERLDREQCNTKVCTQWLFGQWSECSTSCGLGTETRDARCVDRDGKTLADSQCEVREKILRKQCRRADCPSWKVGSWSSCSVSCLEGYRQRSVQCVESSGRATSDQHCLKMDPRRPVSHEPCSQGACPFWRMGIWSRCSVSCGDGGVRERKVECVHKDQVVDASLCSNDAQPAPMSREPCRLLGCSEWAVEAWDQCSAECGAGVQRRQVKCKRGTEVLADRECNSAKPKSERACERRACSPQQQPNTHVQMYQRQERPKIYWATGAWTDCSKKCGGGTQRRAVQCHGHNRILPADYCKWLEKEPDTRECNIKPCVQWLALDWQPCQTTCGTRQLQQRKVICVPVDKNLTREESAKITNTDCDPTQQPPPTKSCNLRPCPQEPKVVYGEWTSGEWSACSTSCGIGYKRRSVFCSLTLCRENQKPAQFEHCNLGECKQRTWQVGPWSHCSVSCGSDGIQLRKVWCQADQEPLKQLSDSECDRSERPSSRRGCAQGICPKSQPARLPSTTTYSPFNSRRSNTQSLQQQGPKYSWNSGEWTTCSTSCGPGVRSRNLWCSDLKGNVSEELCERKDRPASEQRCRQTHCARWHKEPWSTCSASCGSGVRRRKVYCRKGRHEKVADQECSLLDRPEDLKPCELRRCPTYNWKITPWSRCTDCKAGDQHRRVYCMSDDRKRAAPRMCQNSTEPITKRPCQLQTCPYHWVPGPWSQCSKTCGNGYHFRKIECKVKSRMIKSDKLANKKQRPSEPTVLSSMCIALEKPTVSAECQMNPCNSKFQWEVGPWSTCSSSCGAGFRRRRIKCMQVDKNTRAEREQCDRKFKPARREQCFVRNCLPNDCAELKAQNTEAENFDGNYTILVAGYRVQVYCHQMNETLPKTYINVASDGNYAEFYGKRLIYPYTCPNSGQRNDSCECTNDGHSSAGRTEFSKLRVDLHNMKINPHDFTFSKTLHGSQVALGTAGDCFSMSDCPQGQFSIDLRSTGVRLVDDLQWKDQGHRTSSRIERKFNNAVIQGQCGGYCGECGPDKFKGLVIEIDHKQKPAIGAG